MGKVRVDKQPFATLVARDGPSFDLHHGVCRQCGLEVGVAKSLALTGPRAVAFDAITGPGPGKHRIEFIRHACATTGNGHDG